MEQNHILIFKPIGHIGAVQTMITSHKHGI